MQFTEDQKKAIDAQGNVVVEAAAGSGKTRVLVERCIQNILDKKCDISEVLMLTFTEAAAGEMRSRIRERLTEVMLEAADQREQERLENEVAELEKADITTIHSFCSQILFANYQTCGFRECPTILDPVRTSALLNEAFDNVLTTHFIKDDTADPVIILLSDYYNHNKRALYGAANHLIDTAAAMPDPDNWLESQKRISFTDWGKGITEYLRELFSNNILPIGTDGFLNAQQITTEFLKENLPNEKQSKKAGELVNAYKDELKTPTLFEQSKNFIALLIDFTQELKAEFSRLKFQTNGATFDDLLFFANAILQDTSIAEKYQKQYKLIFVDEFQDTDRIQDEILQRIANNNRFIVGDWRQSIYSFRNADPLIFRSYINDKNSNHTHCGLSDNFRSHPNIINFTNSLFNSNPIPNFDQMRPARKENLESPSPRVEISWSHSDGNSDLSSDEQEAYLLAEKLSQIHNSKLLIFDKERNQNCAMCWKDVCILVRGSIDKLSRTLVPIFQKKNIPLRISGFSLLDCVEIKDILNLIHILDNPRKEYNLLGFLSSPFVGITLEELLQFKTAHKIHNDWWDAITQISENEPRPCTQKLLKFRTNYTNWRQRLHLLPLTQLIEDIIIETKYEQFLGDFAETKRENICRFITKIEEFDVYHRQGIRRFLDYIQALEDTGKTEESLPAVPISIGNNNNEGAVQVTTIHKSKGLEYPIVFLVHAYTVFQTERAEDNIYISKKFGIASKTFIPAYKNTTEIIYQTANTSYLIVSRENETKDNLEEEKRLLYVAVTRARDYLYIYGCEGGKKGTSYMTWIQDWLTDHGELPTLDAAKNDKKTITFNISVANPEESDKDQFIPISVTLYSADYIQKLKEKDDDVASDSDVSHIASTNLNETSTHLEAYAHQNATTIPSKTTVTTLKSQALDTAPEEYDNSNYDCGETYSGKYTDREKATQRGIDYHRIMEQINLSSIESLTEQIEKIVESRNIETAINSEQITKFWSTEVGKAFLKNRDKLARELQFTCYLTKDDLEKLKRFQIQNILEETSGEKIILQGTIDLAMIDSVRKEIWILDYKTDSLEHTGEHTKQLMLYKLAMEKIYMGYTVTKLYLAYLLRDEIIVDITGNTLPQKA